MPELPEVEVVRRGLERWVAGRTVEAVEVLHPGPYAGTWRAVPTSRRASRARPSGCRGGAGSTCGCPWRGGTCPSSATSG